MYIFWWTDWDRGLGHTMTHGVGSEASQWGAGQEQQYNYPQHAEDFSFLGDASNGKIL